MEHVKYLIIGAGITGLTVASYLKDNYAIIEKEGEPGGYCRTVYDGEYVWDYAGHFFHFKSEEFRQKFVSNLKRDDFVKQEKKTYIYYKDKLIDYPFQMNIHELDKEEFIDCLYDLFNRNDSGEYTDFLDMLYGKFGISITEKFLKPYNEKLYACDLASLDKDAMGRFFPYADPQAIINNMKDSADHSYNNTFLYPKRGAEVIIDEILKDIDESGLRLNSSVDKINLIDKKVNLNDGELISYDYLINTIPFNKFIKLVGIPEFDKLSEELSYNKVLVFNLGFNKKSRFDKQHWLYFPDKEINFYRAGFYDNILETDKLSMYIEIGYDKNADIDSDEIEKQLELTLANLKKTGIIDDSFDLAAHADIVMDPAYVHIDNVHENKIVEIKKELRDTDVFSIGRYGGWTYCSMEDCMIEAKKTAEDIKNEMSWEKN